MANEVTKTGVFLDLKSMKVVKSPPEEGYQLVPPGGEVTPERQATIDRFKADAETISGEKADYADVWENAEPHVVETATEPAVETRRVAKKL